MEKMKRCSCCKVEKPIEEFPIDRSKRDGFFHKCKKCLAAADRRRYGRTRDKQISQARRWNTNNPDRYKDIQLQLHYGISLADYNEMLKDQDGVCAICRKPDKRALSVDHCHTTNAIRGLLCGGCNRALGILDDDVNRVSAMVNYLRKQYPEQNQIHEVLEAAERADRQCPAYNKASPGLLSCL